MQTVYSANNLFDAHLVKHALEDAGIPAHVFGESLLGGMGELPVFGVLRVCVPEAALGRAREVVAALALDAPEHGPGDGDDDPLGVLQA